MAHHGQYDYNHASSILAANMKLMLSIIAALLAAFFALAQQNVQAQQITQPAAPALAAKSYVLYDVTSNQILASQDGDKRIEPASLTKMMTAYVTFSALKLNQLSLGQSTFPPAEALHSQEVESRMFLDKSKPVTIAELLRGLIVQSGNDAARVLANVIAGSEDNFAGLMNKEARRLNMKNTRFVNATGVTHPQHYSSAYDLVLLAAAIVRDFPEYYPIYAMREFQYNHIPQANRNRLLWMDPYADGMSTGYNEGTGFYLVASAKRNQRRLISVVLGTTSDSLRATESQKLLNFGFQDFEAVRLYQRNQPVASVRLWKGTESTVNVGFRKDFFLSIPKGQLAQMKATMETKQPLIAPISGGQAIGTMKLALNGRPYAEVPLLALDSVPEANVFSRGWDSIRLLFE